MTETLVLELGALGEYSVLGSRPALEALADRTTLGRLNISGKKDTPVIAAKPFTQQRRDKFKMLL